MVAKLPRSGSNRGRFRGLRLLALTMLAITALPLPGQDSASASCAAPYLLLRGSQHGLQVQPSSAARIEGRAFVRGCDDTGSSAGSWGCGSDEPRTQEVPMRDVKLVLKQGRHQWPLGSEDAGTAAESDVGRITWQVIVPAHARPGRAVLIADVPPPGRDRLDARLTVTVSR